MIYDKGRRGGGGGGEEGKGGAVIIRRVIAINGNGDNQWEGHVGSNSVTVDIFHQLNGRYRLRGCLHCSVGVAAVKSDAG